MAAHIQVIVPLSSTFMSSSVSLIDLDILFIHNSPSPFVLSEKGAQVQEKLWGEVLAVLEKIDKSIPDIVSQL